MKNRLTLVIMAAGMGSRFGGLKQVTPIGPNGEFIIDYSIYDAIKAGFSKVIFIIKKENYDLFRDTIGKRIENKIEVCYAFQDMLDVPEKINVPMSREKPLGTAHAIYTARKFIDDNFAIINADDFYGSDSFVKMAKYLENISIDSNHFCMIGYRIKNTMSLNGSVKRGVCEIDNNYLTSLIESNVSYDDNKIIASPLSGDDSFCISPDRLVSMNMFGFTPYILNLIEDEFYSFFNNISDINKDEYLIPNVVFSAVKEKKCDVKVIDTNSVWYGVTYKEDKDFVSSSINKLVNSGEYPSNLW